MRSSLFAPHSRWVLADYAGSSVSCLPQSTEPTGGDLSAAQPLTKLPLLAQNPGPGRVLRCRASTACQASWSASPPRAPQRPLFCWRTRRRSRLPIHKTRWRRVRSSAAPPPLPRTPPRSAQGAQTPTPSTRCSEEVCGRMRGLRCPRAGGRVPPPRIPHARTIELKCQPPLSNSL